MNTYIVELAGRDSVASIRKFMTNNKNSRIIPSIVYTRTEYGGFDSYYESLQYLQQCASELGIVFEQTLHISNEIIWNTFCIRYQYDLYKSFGFYTPCIMCHVLAHILRVPLAYKFGAKGIVTGERMKHGNKTKLNQHQLTLECYRRLINYAGLELIQPLLDVVDMEDINREIANEYIVENANNTKCILSGNIKENVISDIQLQDFLDNYIYKIGVFIIDCYNSNKELSFIELRKYIEDLL